MKRLDSFLLSAIGTLCAHQVAYSVAPLIGSQPEISHSHLGVLWKFSLLAAVVAVAVAVLRGLRSRSYKLTSPGRYGFGLAIAFTTLEAIERAVEGYSPTILAGEPVFWIGLLATVPVALVSCAVLGTVTKTASKFSDLTKHQTWPPVLLNWPTTDFLVTAIGASYQTSYWSRGPPKVAL